MATPPRQGLLQRARCRAPVGVTTIGRLTMARGSLIEHAERPATSLSPGRGQEGCGRSGPPAMPRRGRPWEAREAARRHRRHIREGEARATPSRAPVVPDEELGTELLRRLGHDNQEPGASRRSPGLDEVGDLLSPAVQGDQKTGGGPHRRRFYSRRRRGSQDDRVRRLVAADVGCPQAPRRGDDLLQPLAAAQRGEVLVVEQPLRRPPEPAVAALAQHRQGLIGATEPAETAGHPEGDLAP
jgi:hypothetical protein